MRKNMRVLRLVRGVLFAAAVALAVSFAGFDTYAGFGDLNDYDYGGDDWGDDDWGDSYDYDDDWGGGSYSYSYSGSHASVGSASFPVVVVVIAIIIVYSVSKSRSAKRGQGANQIPTARNLQSRRNNANQPAKTLPDRTEQISQIMKAKDVNFTANDFLSYVKRVYVDIQEAWAKRDLEPVRSVLHPNLYQQTQQQIEMKIADGIVNHLERIAVNTAYLTGYRQDDDYEYMVVYLAAQMIDYQVKEETGEVIGGDKNTLWHMFYKMTFVRAITMQTPDITEAENEVMRCPSCGAPIEGTAFGKCEYCGTVVSTGKYGWVLSDFGIIRNDTRDEGIHLKTER